MTTNKVTGFDEFKMAVSALLLQARKEAHLSQQEVAELIGKKRTTISRQERGEFKDITLGDIFDYAECYKIPVERLLPCSVFKYEFKGHDISSIIEELKDMIARLEEVYHFTN